LSDNAKHYHGTYNESHPGTALGVICTLGGSGKF